MKEEGHVNANKRMRSPDLLSCQGTGGYATTRHSCQNDSSLADQVLSSCGRKGEGELCWVVFFVGPTGVASFEKNSVQNEWL